MNSCFPAQRCAVLVLIYAIDNEPELWADSTAEQQAIVPTSLPLAAPTVARVMVPPTSMMLIVLDRT